MPAAPEFAELLEAIPESQRQGKVFKVPRAAAAAGTLISQIGRAAKIITNEETGKGATAQDYRRAFGTRWAKRVMPAVLQRLMRHKSIQTTLAYYVDQQAEDIAEDLYKCYKRAGVNENDNSRPHNAVFPRS